MAVVRLCAADLLWVGRASTQLSFFCCLGKGEKGFPLALLLTTLAARVKLEHLIACRAEAR